MVKKLSNDTNQYETFSQYQKDQTEEPNLNNTAHSDPFISPSCANNIKVYTLPRYVYSAIARNVSCIQKIYKIIKLLVTVLKSHCHSLHFLGELKKNENKPGTAQVGGRSRFKQSEVLELCKRTLLRKPRGKTFMLAKRFFQVENFLKSEPLPNEIFFETVALFFLFEFFQLFSCSRRLNVKRNYQRFRCFISRRF